MIKANWVTRLMVVGMLALVAWMPSLPTTDQINTFSLGASIIRFGLLWSPQVHINTREPLQLNSKTILVSSTNDHGPGSLRQALLNTQGYETILFDPAVFPPDSPATIFVLSTMPELVAGGVIIDGSEAGVILDGSKLPHEQPIEGQAFLS